MRETQRPFFNRRAGYLLVAGAFSLLCVFFLYRSLGARSERVRQVKIVAVNATLNRAISAPVVDFDSVAYYRPIIEYNLFRPLGWTPPVPREPYRLVGTILPRAPDAGFPQAIIEATGGGVSHIVSVGDALDSVTTVTGIESKSVVLETSGLERTLTLGSLQYLNPSGSRRLASIPTPVRRSSAVSQTRRVVSQGVASKAVAPLRALPFSEWETVEGERIRVGDARLKNPQKWRLRRR